MRDFKIAVIPGDGIGKEVVPEGIRVLEAAAAKHGLRFRWDGFPWSCEYHLEHGRMMPENGLDLIRHHDAIFLGAVGFPGVPDHVSLWGLLIPIRRGFRQYANLRPVKLMPGVPCPLAGRQVGDIDMMVVRENNEGEYSSIGGRLYEGTDQEMAVQQSVFTRQGVDRILKIAFDIAQSRPKRHLTSATKSNGIAITMPYWDERVKAMSVGYPEVKVDQFHVDILCAQFVRNPHWFDVVVGSNLFGDILSDLGPACTGTIAIAPQREPESRARIPFHVRARPWLGAGHLRQRHRQSHRPDLGRRHDAGPPGLPRGGGLHHGRDRKSAGQWPAHSRHGWHRQHCGHGPGHRRRGVATWVGSRQAPRRAA